MPRALLTEEAQSELRRLLQPPSKAPDGNVEAPVDWSGRLVSRALLEELGRHWRSHPDYEAAAPILLGSGARGEITLRSDVDLLIAGDLEAGGRWIRSLQESGIKVRARTPENSADWTDGANEEDHLALLEAIPLGTRSAELLEHHRNALVAKAQRRRKEFLSKIIRDQKERARRYDSIAGFLEPNLKYGPGGLRDLEQARQIARLFPDRFPEGEHALRVLAYYADFWLLLRHRLHLSSQNDVLTGQAQFELAAWMGVLHKDFMRQVQRGLARVSFYSSWIRESARLGTREWQESRHELPRSRRQVLQMLADDPSVLAQRRIRARLDDLFPKSWEKKEHIERGRLLARVLRPGAPEAFVRAVFSSRLIDHLCPEIRPLVGYVQHDQYHRYAADVHLQQACIQYQRVLEKPRRIGPLAPLVKKLSLVDRWVLAWTMLFHDIMKGRDGDHSVEGTRWVRAELRRYGLRANLINEVAWMVENHLALSTAAFRRNPQSPQTWRELMQMGAQGPRLRRLAIFTAVDILATNPEAWTSWKAGLLAELVRTLDSPPVRRFQEWERTVRTHRLPSTCLELDPYLLQSLPAKKLAADIQMCRGTTGSADPALWVIRSRLWVRFHRRKDESGLFSEFAQRLYDLGLNVRHASIHSLDGVGVYDWFQVSGRKSPGVLLKWLSLPAPRKRAPARVSFEKINWVNRTEAEWIVSFQGLDQPGFLAAAAQALADEGCFITGARVHTWGRRVDDLFHLRPTDEGTDPVERIRRRLGMPSDKVNRQGE